MLENLIHALTLLRDLVLLGFVKYIKFHLILTYSMQIY
jgi:hypothetical protein